MQPNGWYEINIACEERFMVSFFKFMVRNDVEQIIDLSDGVELHTNIYTKHPRL